MVSLKKWLFVTLAVLIPLCANAEKPEKNLAYELYVKSGLEKQIEQLPLAIQAGISQSFDKKNGSRQMPESLFAKLRALMKESFSSESIKKTVLEQIETQISQKEMQGVLKWLDSPVGKKCTQLEEASSSPEAIADKIQNFPGQLEKTPPSKERLTLIQKLSSAVKAEENFVEVIMNMQLAVTTAVTLTLPSENQRAFLEKIKDNTEMLRPQIESLAKSETLTSFLYTYRGLPDSELEEYVKFADSDVGVKYHSVTSDALKKAITECSIKWGSSIAKLLDTVGKKSEI